MDELESIKSAASSSARRHPEDIDSDDNNDSESAHLNQEHSNRDEDGDGDDNDEDEDNFDIIKAGPGTNMRNFKNATRLSGSFQTVCYLFLHWLLSWDNSALLCTYVLRIFHSFCYSLPCRFITSLVLYG